jgi:hypothetical protein
MKYILTISFLFFCLNVFGQAPITQTMGSPSTDVRSKGVLSTDSSFTVRTNFSDTSFANLGWIKNIPGTIIRSGGKLWLRNQAASQWVEITTGGGATPTWDATLIAGSQLSQNHTVDLNGTRLSFNGSGTGSVYLEGLSEFYHTVDDNNMPQFVLREYPNGAGGALAEWSLTGSSPSNARETGVYFQSDGQTDSTGQLTIHAGAVPNQSKNGQSATSIRVRPQGIRIYLRDNIAKNFQIVNPTITSDTAWKALAYNPADSSVRVLNNYGGIAKNIYNSDGTLTGIRNVNLNSNNLYFNNSDQIEFNGTGITQRARLKIDTTMTIGRGENALENQATIEISQNNELILQGNTENSRFLAIKPSPNRGFFSFHDNFATGSNYYMAFISNGAIQQGEIGGRSGSGDEFYVQTSNGARLALVDSGYGTHMRIADYTSASNGDVLTLANNTTGEVEWTTPSSGSGMAIGGTITGGTATRALFVGTNGLLQQRTNYSFDSTNLRLGIGTNSPAVVLHTVSTIADGYSGYDVGFRAQGNNPAIQFLNSAGTQGWQFDYQNVTGNFILRTEAGTEYFKVNRLSGDFETKPSTSPSNIKLAWSGTSYFNTGNVAIGASTANASAKLDIQSTTQGFLPPRLNTSQMNAVSSPATGLAIWNTDSLRLFSFDGTSWKGYKYTNETSGVPTLQQVLTAGSTLTTTNVIDANNNDFAIDNITDFNITADNTIVNGPISVTGKTDLGGALTVAYSSTATGITLNTTHCIVEVTATGQTITLPTAPSVNGRYYTIKLTASGTGTIATTSSQTIDGSTTYSLSAQYKYVTVVSNGSNWIIVANN